MMVISTKRIRDKHIQIHIREPEDGTAYKELQAAVNQLNRRCRAKGDTRYSYIIVRQETEGSREDVKSRRRGSADGGFLEECRNKGLRWSTEHGMAFLRGEYGSDARVVTADGTVDRYGENRKVTRADGTPF